MNYITPKELREKLKLSKNTAYKLISQKGFPKIYVGNKILIPEEELDKYMMSHLKSRITL